MTGEGRPALVFVEHDEEGPLDSSLRAVTLARSFAAAGEGAPPEGGTVALLAGDPAGGSAAALGEHGVAAAHVLRIGSYAPVAVARALAALADEVSAAAVLAAGTDHGQEVMAHLAALTGEEMVANCLAVEPAEGGWHITRHRWGGSLVEEARLRGARALVTVASDAVTPSAAPLGRPAELREFSPPLSELDLALSAKESREQVAGVSLASARVVVSGGRGVGGEAGFAVIEELAGMLGGAVGVSRAVTSLGWRPHKEQVGQTGTRVAPELYLACGISGAIQHLAGCQAAKTMVAINTDAQAPIMARADYAVIGDVGEVLPALVEALRARS